MKQLYKIKITHIQPSGKIETREFKEIKSYGWTNNQTSSFFYMIEVGTLSEKKTSGKYETKQHWFRAEDILEIEAFGGNIAETEKELSQLKKEL